VDGRVQEIQMTFMLYMILLEATISFAEFSGSGFNAYTHPKVGSVGAAFRLHTRNFESAGFHS